jgi:PAS domain S-box-containing protein
LKAKSTIRLVESARRHRLLRRKTLPPSASAGDDAPPFRALAESMLDGAVTLTPSGNILHSNLAFAEMMETPFDQLIGKSFFSFVQLGWNQRFFDFLHCSLEKSGTVEVSLLTRGGKEISALLTSNAFSVREEKAVFLTVSNLKGRKEIEEALYRSKQRLETVADLTSHAIWEWDTSSREIWRSEGFAALLGYPAKEMKSTPMWWKHAIHPEDRSPVFSALEQLVKTGGTLQQTYRVRRFDGSYAEVIDRATAIRDGAENKLRLIGSIADVTEQNRAAAAKQEMSRRVMQAQEQERQRVARDLHDGVSQLLASSNFRLHHIEQQLGKSDKTLLKKVAEARVLVEKAHQELQLISRNLRPSELDDLGLNAALRSLCAEFQNRTRVQTIFKTSEIKALGPDAELTLYRIAQEALNNVEKHADAKQVQLSLKRKMDFIVLTIRDDGKGFASDGEMKGWGLANMRERAEYFSGTLRINSRRNLGTSVIVTVPV